MGKIVQVQQQKAKKELVRIDAKIKTLSSRRTRRIKMLEMNAKPIEKVYRPSYVKRLRKIIKNTEQGKALKFKNMEEFAEYFGCPDRMTPKKTSKERK